MARKADTGVNRSALTDFITGTSVDSRASRANSLKSGCSMWVFHYRGRLGIVCQPAPHGTRSPPANFGHYGELQPTAKIFFFRPLCLLLPYPGRKGMVRKITAGELPG